jgi:hypothetical protein
VFFVMIVPLLIGIQVFARPVELGTKATRR